MPEVPWEKEGWLGMRKWGQEVMTWCHGVWGGWLQAPQHQHRENPMSRETEAARSGVTLTGVSIPASAFILRGQDKSHPQLAVKEWEAGVMAQPTRAQLAGLFPHQPLTWGKLLSL